MAHFQQVSISNLPKRHHHLLSKRPDTGACEEHFTSQLSHGRSKPRAKDEDTNFQNASKWRRGWQSLRESTQKRQESDCLYRAPATQFQPMVNKLEISDVWMYKQVCLWVNSVQQSNEQFLSRENTSHAHR